jgi:hypothetical protein
MIKIGFDVGGVLSKYPEILTPLINIIVAACSDQIEIHVLSDMHPKEKIIDWLQRNQLNIKPENVHSCDYAQHGELCKAIKCHELNIGIMMDDFVGYVAEGAPLRLLVMPDPHRPYFHDDWKTDGSEGDFGRRKK